MKETTVSSTSILMLRITVRSIFIATGINHLQKPQSIAQRIMKAPSGELIRSIAYPYFLALSSGALLLLFGITFLLCIYMKISASALVLSLLPITLSIQLHEGILFSPLWKNVALLDSLSFFIINKHLPFQNSTKTK